MARGKMAAALAVLPLILSSCQALYFLQGKGQAKALYTLPAKERVLVFVDASPSVSLPPNFATNLGQAITDHLYKYKAADTLVAQDRLKPLREDPTFGQLGIADVARMTNADVVLYVNIVTFNLSSTTGGTVTQGDAEAMVKVVDKKGERLWPVDEPAGRAIGAHVGESLAEDRDRNATAKELARQLTVHAGRMFHPYSLDDADMTK